MVEMKSIYVLDELVYGKGQKERLLALGDVKIFEKPTESEIDEAIGKADIMVLDYILDTRDDILTSMRKGQFVVLPFTGYNSVKTVKQAVDNGVLVSYVPHYSTQAVAEHHLALMLSACKNVVQLDNVVRAGGKPAPKDSIELKGKTVGIVGYGDIGKRLAELVKPFGVKIILCNSTSNNLDELLKESDFVCVTCSLNKQTANMISDKQFALMKQDAILTQTTGGIVDMSALYKTLQSGKLYAVGIDDIDKQVNELPKGLLQHDKVICTWHRAYRTIESEYNRTETCIENIKAFIDGKPINLVQL